MDSKDWPSTTTAYDKIWAQEKSYELFPKHSNVAVNQVMQSQRESFMAACGLMAEWIQKRIDEKDSSAHRESKRLLAENALLKNEIAKMEACAKGDAEKIRRMVEYTKTGVLDVGPIE